jgi:hypothetical protein
MKRVMVSSRLIIFTLLCMAWETNAYSVTNKPAAHQIPSNLVRVFFKEVCSGLGGCSDEEIKLWRSNFKYEVHDLNGDRIPEFFLYIDHPNWCGAGFNCNFWVFQRSGRSYKLLVENPVIKVSKTKTKGYRDLESLGRMGGCIFPDGEAGEEKYVTLYKYDGRKYKPLVIGEQCRRFKPKR